MTNIRFVLLVFALAAAMLPASVLAQDSDEDGLLLRIGGSTRLASDESVGVLVTVSSDVVVDGRVDDGMVLLGSDTVVNGTVDGDIIAVGGSLRLGPDAVVTGDVAYNNTTFVTDADAVIQGTVRDNLGVNLSRDVTRFVAWLSLATWAGSTLLALAAGMVFAGIGGRQLWACAGNITRRPLQSLLSIIALWMLGAVLVVVLFISILGIPVALAIVLILGAVWSLGHIVAGTRIGAALTRRSIDDRTIAHPYLPALIGITVVQLVALVPVLVGLLAAYATADDATGLSPLSVLAVTVSWSINAVIGIVGMLGAGAMIYYAWRAWTSDGADPMPTAGQTRR